MAEFAGLLCTCLPQDSDELEMPGGETFADFDLKDAINR